MMNKGLVAAAFLLTLLTTNTARAAKCDWNFDVLGLDGPWSIEEFINDLPDNAVCEIGQQIRGNLEDVAAAWAKKAAISALDGFTGGMFSMLAGTLSGGGQPKQPDYSRIVSSMDKIIEAHFAKAYRDAFEDRKAVYQTNYIEYMETFSRIPIVFLKEKADDGTLTDAEERQFDFIIDRTQKLIDDVNVLLEAQGMFGPRNDNRWRAAKVFLNLASQRIALRRELNFALNLSETSTAQRRKETVESMLNEFGEWLDDEYFIAFSARGTGAGIPCTTWSFGVKNIQLSPQLERKRSRLRDAISPPSGGFNLRSSDNSYVYGGRYCFAPGREMRLPRDFQEDIIAVESQVIKEHFFGPHVHEIIEDWVSRG